MGALFIGLEVRCHRSLLNSAIVFSLHNNTAAALASLVYIKVVQNGNQMVLRADMKHTTPSSAALILVTLTHQSTDLHWSSGFINMLLS